MDSIMLQAPIEQLGERLIIRLSDDVSTQLPSRGQVAADITVDDTTFLAVIEPDGMRGHWLPINAAFLEASNLQPEQAVGQQVTLSINPTNRIYPQTHRLWKAIVKSWRVWVDPVIYS